MTRYTFPIPPWRARLAALACLFGIAACTRDAPSAITPPSSSPFPSLLHPVSSRVAASVDAGSTQDPCLEVIERIHQTLVKEIPHNDYFSPHFYESPSHCVATRSGVWALTAREVSVKAVPSPSSYGGPTVEIRGSWTLDYIGPTGQSVEGPPLPFTIVPYSSENREISHPFDYDGDGTPEIAMWEHRSSIEYARSTGSLWTVRDGAVVPYHRAGSINIEDVEDVDGDGRPDLLTIRPYNPDPAPKCEGIDRKPSPIVPFLAHSIADGSFSMTDDVATKFAMDQCPSQPSDLKMGAVAGDEPLRTIRCARLWGATAADVAAMIHRTCTREARDCNLEKGACLGYLTMMAWASAPPPLTLKR